MSFDAAVLRAERVGDARFRLPEAFGDEQGRVQSLRRQITDDRISAPFGQIEIVIFSPDCVRMTVDLELLALKSRVLQRFGELIQILLCHARQLVRVEFEIDEQVKTRLRRSGRLSCLRQSVPVKTNTASLGLQRCVGSLLLGEKVNHLICGIGRIGVSRSNNGGG